MTEQIMRDNLTVLAQAYATGHRLALATVSKQIHGKHTFLQDFIAGRASTTIKTYFLMVGKLRDRWPSGTKWPETREVPKLAQVPYDRMVAANRRSLGTDGKFVGKNVPKRRGR